MSKTNTPPQARKAASAPRRRTSVPAPEKRPDRGAATHPAPRPTAPGVHHRTGFKRPPPTRDEIARRAYEIWEQTGRPTGHDAEHWAQAERELWAGCPASAGDDGAGAPQQG